MLVRYDLLLQWRVFWAVGAAINRDGCWTFMKIFIFNQRHVLTVEIFDLRIQTSPLTLLTLANLHIYTKTEHSFVIFWLISITKPLRTFERIGWYFSVIIWLDEDSPKIFQFFCWCEKISDSLGWWRGVVIECCVDDYNFNNCYQLRIRQEPGEW